MTHFNSKISGKAQKIEISDDGTILVDGTAVQFETQTWKKISQVICENQHYNIFVKQLDDVNWEIWIKHFVILVSIEDHRSGLLSKFKESIITLHERIEVVAPMPGLIIGLDSSAGKSVSAGDRVAVLEAMKMENEIRSHATGTIESVRVTKGDIVEKGQLLMIITRS